MSKLLLPLLLLLFGCSSPPNLLGTTINFIPKMSPYEGIIFYGAKCHPPGQVVEQTRNTCSVLFNCEYINTKGHNTSLLVKVNCTDLTDTNNN